MRIYMKPTGKKVTKSMKGQYNKYLKSFQWKEKRKSAIEFYGNQCSLCGSSHNIEIHHRSYKNLYKETMADLMVLCESCHYKFHRSKKEKKEQGKRRTDNYYRNPNYDTAPTTYYPKRSSNEDTGT